MPPAPHLTVWYNTKCPVCNGGIDWQRNKLLAAVRAGDIAFKDINVEPAALATYGATLDDVRRRLHATDGQGRLIVGADVARAGHHALTFQPCTASAQITNTSSAMISSDHSG